MDNTKKVLEDMVSPKDTGMVRSSVFGASSGTNGFFGRPRRVPEGSILQGDILPPNNPRHRLWYFLGALGIVAVLAVTYLLGNIFFTKATVTVTLKQDTAQADTTIIAQKDPTDQKVLPFQLVTIEEGATKEIQSIGTNFIEHKASGQIVIYNNYSSEPQRFVKNTRFQTADGKVFRVNSAITIPGSKVVSGKTVPGSLTVTVYADQPGVQYNIGLTDFTLPALKDSDPVRYKGFYARSKIPMTGGVSGEVVTPAVDELGKARAVLDQEIGEKLQTNLQSKIPAGFIMFKSLTTTTFSLEDAPENIAEKGKAPKTYLVKEKGVLTGVTFDLNLFSEYLARRILSGYTGGGVSIQNLGDLTVIPTTPLSDILPEKEFPFHVRGNVLFSWNVNTEALRNDLIGVSRSKEARAEIFKKYPSILQANVDIRPFWRSNFPDKTTLINIISTTTAVAVDVK